MRPSPLEAYDSGLARLPRVPLIDEATPVRRLSRESSGIAIYVKDDSACSSPYGGNKVRKLEYLLGAALEAGATEILTSGSTSSNHALATAIHGARFGLRTTVLLVPHPSPRVLPLLVMHRLGASLELQAPGVSMRPEAPAHRAMLERMRARGAKPFVIPFGGTTPEGTLGFVSAVLELRAQVEAGLLPEPHRIFVPVGSWGTAAGIALGLEIAKMRSEVVAVRAVDQPATVDDISIEIERARACARRFAPSFPASGDAGSRVRLCHAFSGGRSGSHTDASRAAALAAERHGLRLEDPYTTKTFAALLDESSESSPTPPARGRAGDGEVLLFWNTENRHDLAPLVEGASEDELPEALRPSAELTAERLEPGGRSLR